MCACLVWSVFACSTHTHLHANTLRKREREKGHILSPCFVSLKPATFNLATRYFAGLPIKYNWIKLNRVSVTIERIVKVVLTFIVDIISNRQVIYCSLFSSAYRSSVDSFRSCFKFVSIWFKLKKSTIKCEWHYRFKAGHTSISLYCLPWDKVETVFLIQQLLEICLATGISYFDVEIQLHSILNIYNCINSCSRRCFNEF